MVGQLLQMNFITFSFFFFALCHSNTSFTYQNSWLNFRQRCSVSFFFLRARFKWTQQERENTKRDLSRLRNQRLNGIWWGRYAAATRCLAGSWNAKSCFTFIIGQDHSAASLRRQLSNETRKGTTNTETEIERHCASMNKIISVVSNGSKL